MLHVQYFLMFFGSRAVAECRDASATIRGSTTRQRDQGERDGYAENRMGIGVAVVRDRQRGGADHGRFDSRDRPRRAGRRASRRDHHREERAEPESAHGGHRQAGRLPVDQRAARDLNVTAELQGFQKLVRADLVLHAGLTSTSISS